MSDETNEVLTVHVLRDGLAVCELDGVPAMWPDDHRWTYPDQLQDATCRACLDQLSKEKQLVKPAMPVPNEPDATAEEISPDEETKEDPRGQNTSIECVRSLDEIATRIKELEAGKSDWAGFEREDLVTRLDFARAKPYLKDDITADDWTPDGEGLYFKMCDYMAFAWGKANDERGLSAGRSLAHYSAWLWLVGNEKLAEEIREYKAYGKPQLIMICEFLGLDAAQWDDGVRTNG